MLMKTLGRNGPSVSAIGRRHRFRVMQRQTGDLTLSDSYVVACWAARSGLSTDADEARADVNAP